MKLFLDENFDYTKIWLHLQFCRCSTKQKNLTENFGHASAFMSWKIIFQLINALAFIKQLTNYTGNERERG